MTTGLLFALAIGLIVGRLFFWVVATLTAKPASDKRASSRAVYTGPLYNAHGREL